MLLAALKQDWLGFPMDSQYPTGSDSLGYASAPRLAAPAHAQTKFRDFLEQALGWKEQRRM